MSKMLAINDSLAIVPRALKNILKSDLQIFIEKYQPSKYKQMPGKIEVRSVYNLEEAKNKAREVINEYGLGLVVVSTGEMAAYKAFEVKEVVS